MMELWQTVFLAACLGFREPQEGPIGGHGQGSLPPAEALKEPKSPILLIKPNYNM